MTEQDSAGGVVKEQLCGSQMLAYLWGVEKDSSGCFEGPSPLFAG
jgi:hypothetical protein